MAGGTEAKDGGADAPTHDVAISFLSQDQTIAGELAARLAEGLRVFYYPRSQEELAGTDGLESMRLPFLSDSRLVVVLHRDRWGKTPWTRVEEAAVKDGCLEHGWERLFVVQLDKSSAFPIWLPRTHVRFVFADYGVDQLVGAIKARVQEQGGMVLKPSAASRARRVEQEAQYLAEKRRLFRDRAWIVGTVQSSALAAMNRAVELVLAETSTWDPRPRAETFGEAGRGQLLTCTMSDGRVGLQAQWRQKFVNSVATEAGIVVRLLRGGVALPSERVMYDFDPIVLGQRTFNPDLTAMGQLAWVKRGTRRELLSSDDLANTFATDFITLVGKANRGQLQSQFA